MGHGCALQIATEHVLQDARAVLANVCAGVAFSQMSRQHLHMEQTHQARGRQYDPLDYEDGGGQLVDAGGGRLLEAQEGHLGRGRHGMKVKRIVNNATRNLTDSQEPRKAN